MILFLPWYSNGMSRFIVIFLISFSLYSQPTGLEVIEGAAAQRSRGNNLVEIEASRGAILYWKDFSIGAHEVARFLQPDAQSWVLNQVQGKQISQILGTLEANGQVVLLNPNGILFGKDAIVEVGGLIASAQGSGEVINRGRLTARDGPLALIGKTTQNHGKMEVLSRLSKHTYMRSDNPYGIPIKGAGLTMWSEEETLVGKEGSVTAENILLLSEGKTYFYGKGAVGSGTMEISGKEGFVHQGTIERNGGTLILDPEANVTISAAPNYNFELKDNLMQPTADIVNLSIDKLIEEIEKGPVMITTFYQGEGGLEGGISIEKDVSHSYDSPYALTLKTAGKKGINLEGSLTNRGEGSIHLQSIEVGTSIQGNLTAQSIRVEGALNLLGEVMGGEIRVHSDQDSHISGKMVADSRDLFWDGKGSLTISGGEIGNMGRGKLSFQGVGGIELKDGAHLFASAQSSGLHISDLNGVFSIEDAMAIGGMVPFTIKGAKGSLALNNGTLSTHGPLFIDLGNGLFLTDSLLSSGKTLDLAVGKELFFTGNSKLQALHGIAIKSGEGITMVGQGKIDGNTLSILTQDSIVMQDNSQMNSGKGPLLISTGKELSLSGDKVALEGERVTVQAREGVHLDKKATIHSRSGETAIFSNQWIHLDQNSRIIAEGGDLTLSAGEGTLYLRGNSELSSTTDALLIKTGHSLIMEGFSKIFGLGEKGAVVVVDEQHLGGGMVIGVNSSMTTGSAPLQIYTSARSFNTIKGTLNGNRHSEAPRFLNTLTEKWGINYPHFVFASPYTVFHQENGLITFGALQLSQKSFSQILINYVGPFTAELFRILHPYNEYISNLIEFSSGFQPPYYQEDLSIRRPSFRHTTSPALQEYNNDKWVHEN